MSSSSFLIEERFRGRYARGSAGGKTVDIPYIRDMPAGSLNVSAEDMGRFITAVIASARGGSGTQPGGKDTLLDAGAQLEMWKRQNEGCSLDFDFSIGLGWWLLELPELRGERLVGHGGDLDSFHALLVVDPARSLGAFVMVNSAKGLGSFSLSGIAAEALGAFGAVTGGAEGGASSAPEEAPMPAGLSSRLEGNFATGFGLVAMKPAAKGLSLRAFGMKLAGRYRDDGSIGISLRILGMKLPVPVLEQLSIKSERIGDETILCFRAGGSLLAIGRKIGAPELDPAWIARVGKWVAIDEEPRPAVDRIAICLDDREVMDFFGVRLARKASVRRRYRPRL